MKQFIMFLAIVVSGDNNKVVCLHKMSKLKVLQTVI